MQRPPSTSSATPVIMLAASEHRNVAAFPISCGVEKRPSGMVARNFARRSGVSSPRKVFSSGVSPATGFSAFTRSPKGASSTAIHRVAVITQPFEALYQVRFRARADSRGRGYVENHADFFALKRGTTWRAAR